MIDMKDLHKRLDALGGELDKVQEKIRLKAALYDHEATVRDLKARQEILKKQLKKGLEDAEKGLGELETNFRKWINHLDFDKKP